MTPMTLETLLREQRHLNRDMGNPMELHGTVDGAVKENMLALIVEATEVLNEINWKPWKRQPHQLKAVSDERLLTELVDVLQFWANAVNSAGFTAEQVTQAYVVKLHVCHWRTAEGAAGGAS